jgi:hypothetical protein
MDVTRQLQEILTQINNDLAPEDRVCEHEIAQVGGELNQMLNTAVAQASGQLSAPAPRRSLKEKLALLWAAIKDKIAAWLSPVTSRWLRFIDRLRAKLQNLLNGNEVLLWTALVAVAIALIAVLLKSMSLLVVLLAIIGFARLVREILPMRWA